MKYSILLAAGCAAFLMTSPAAQAACNGGLGRGWGSGKGDGKFEMGASDSVCLIGFANFVNDATDSRVPAKQVTLTRAPKNGKIGLTDNGVVYTPNPGFKGADKFCTRNKAEGEKGTLSGCVTVTVR